MSDENWEWAERGISPNDKREFEVWMEGFKFSEDEFSKASLRGKVKANSFVEACRILFKDDSLFNEEQMSYWGCGLFDNETEARKFLG